MYPLILLHLLKHCTMRFNELKRTLPTITQKILTKTIEPILETIHECGVARGLRSKKLPNQTSYNNSLISFMLLK
ncbi:MAG: winged helix-turn-helix transcriptional regulator, partial [Paenisporosarcina sp.]